MHVRKKRGGQGKIDDTACLRPLGTGDWGLRTECELRIANVCFVGKGSKAK